MAVMFSGVPDNYDSVFGPLVYTLTGIASGETVDAEVFTVGAETPVGVKRIAGSDAALVNIACYMRRLLTPVPASFRMRDVSSLPRWVAAVRYRRSEPLRGPCAGFRSTRCSLHFPCTVPLPGTRATRFRCSYPAAA